MVVGGIWEDQEHHLHPFLDQGLAAQLDIDLLLAGTAYQYTAGAAYTFEATDTLYPRVSRMPQGLYHRK